MKKKFRIFFAIIVLTLGGLACEALSGGNEPVSNDPPVLPEDPSSEEPEPTDPPVSDNVIFSDDFSSSQWGTGTDSDSAVEYVNNALNFIVFTSNYFVWSTPDDEVYNDIHMDVTVINNDTDSTTAFGFMCDKSDGNDFYYLAVTPAGQYAIAKAVTGETDLFLTNEDQWADSDLIDVNASSYRVGADCGNGLLTLYVDGQEIASAVDSAYSSGRVAVFVWSGEESGLTTDVSFDDFVMTQLP